MAYHLECLQNFTDRRVLDRFTNLLHLTMTVEKMCHIKLDIMVLFTRMLFKTTKFAL